MVHPVIVYNTSYNGLSIIQELGSLGIECYALDNFRSVGSFTKYAKYLKCPDPNIYEKEFIDCLYNFCEKLAKKPVLFPTNDHWALITAKYKHKLSEVSLPCVGSFSSVNTMLKKDIFYKIGQKKGYLTPYTWTLDQLDTITDDKYPIVAKPKSKNFPSEIHNTKVNKNLKNSRLVLINNKNELKNFIKNNKDLLRYMLFQEYVYGHTDAMFTVGIYANNKSNILGIFTGRKVRGYPADIGDNIVGESYSVPHYLIDNTKRIVKDLHFEGIAEFEYKLNKKTGQFKLIEINPRPWSWIGITPYCDVNLPLIAYKSLLGQENSLKQSTAKNGEIKYVKIMQDSFNCIIRYRYNYKPWNLSFEAWRKTLKCKKMVVAEWNKKDLGVLFASIPYFFGKVIFQKWYP